MAEGRKDVEKINLKIDDERGNSGRTVIGSDEEISVRALPLYGRCVGVVRPTLPARTRMPHHSLFYH